MVDREVLGVCVLCCAGPSSFHPYRHTDWAAREASCCVIVLGGSCPWSVVITFLQIKHASARSVQLLWLCYLCAACQSVALNFFRLNNTLYPQELNAVLCFKTCSSVSVLNSCKMLTNGSMLTLRNVCQHRAGLKHILKSYWSQCI